MEFVIEVDSLKKSYGSYVAIEDVSFEVRRGEIFGLLGRNSAGKTTTVECLQGLRRADRGRVRVLGSILRDRRNSCEDPADLRVKQPTLEDVFLRLTNSRKQEEEAA